MVGASGGRGWEVLTAKGCPSFGLSGTLSDTCASRVAEKPPEGARWDRSPQREGEIH